MQYLILNYVPASGIADPAKPHAHPDTSAWGAYTHALIEAGVMRGGQALKPATTATTVRLREGVRQVQDGPYADTHEHLGGFYLIDVPDLDTALQWAARNPAALTGAVEVRPVLTM